MQNNKLENTLSSLSDLPIVRENSLLSKRIDSLKKRLEKNEFQLVILGQFKRGKSTLINSLLGEQILPTSIVPLTSIITVLKYNKTQNITVLFIDNHTKKITFSQLPDYVTEGKNPNNIKQVEQVIIEYPSEYLKNGIQIIDTPGVGSVYQHNTDVAYDFVPKADAGIFLFTADPPISESELKFLTAIKDYLGKIIFVQNKIDQISEKDREESLEFTKKIIKETVGAKELVFYQISAKLGFEGKKGKDSKKLMESKLPMFEEGLNHIFTSQKAHIITKSITKKLLLAVKEINLMLAIEEQSVSMPIAILKEKITAFNKELTVIKQEKEDNDYILQGKLEKLVNQTLIDDIEILKEKELPAILCAFEQFFKSHQDKSGIELSALLDKFLEKSIKKIFGSWRIEEERKLQKSLESILDRFSSQTNNFISRAIELSASLFNLKIGELKTETSFKEEYEFKFSFDEYQVDLDFYTPVVSRLPKFLSHKLLYKNMRDKVIQEFDKHSGRSRYDFHQRVLQSINEFRDNLDERLNEIIEGINIAMKKGLLQREKAESTEKEVAKSLRAQKSILSQISTHLYLFG
jgi:small GTP-binding protein